MRNEEQAYWKVKIRLVWRGVRSTPVGAARKSETPQDVVTRRLGARPMESERQASENKSIILCLKSGYCPSSLTSQFFSALISETAETLQAKGRPRLSASPTESEPLERKATSLFKGINKYTIYKLLFLKFRSLSTV